MECDAHTSLDAASNIIAVPRDTLGHVWIDSRGKEKASSIFGVCVLRSLQQDEADQGSNAETNHEDATGLELVSSPAAGDTAEAGHDIGRHRHELSLVIGVSQSAHNRGEEECERVQWGVLSVLSVSRRASLRAAFYLENLPNGDEHVDPDFPVLDGVPEILQVELIGQ